jgi:D-arabinose 1-dehydrogenase-like Zn-dependent alcohol dehydrogenase
MRFKTAAATAFAVRATAGIAPGALAQTEDAEHTINPTRESFLEAALERIGQFDVVIDNVGPQGDDDGGVPHGGTVVAMGYVDPTLEIPSYDIVIREKQVVGTRALMRMEFREIVQLVSSGTSVPDIGELVPISQVNEAFEKLRSWRCLTRAVLTLPFD